MLSSFAQSVYKNVHLINKIKNKKASDRDSLTMDSIYGLVKVRVRRGINLAIRDTVASDPYVVVSTGDQKVKTRVMKGNCDPVWNEELTLSINDLKGPINITVYDKDTFTGDDKMGDAEFTLTTLINSIRMGLEGLPDGTKVDRLQPNRSNCLVDESCVVWEKGKMTQDMLLRLRNVECGKLQIQIEWIDVQGAKGLL